MASFNQYGIKNQNESINTQSSNKVYINPNFHRTNTVPSQSSALYVNAQFIHKRPSLQPANVKKTKIFVNPNFVRKIAAISSSSNNFTTTRGHNVVSSTSIVNSDYGLGNALRTSEPVKSTYPTTSGLSNIDFKTSENRVFSVGSSLQLPIVNPNIQPQNAKTPIAEVTKSRYSLVRRTNVRKLDTYIPDRTVAKLKINKYKTISLDHVQKMQRTERDKSKSAFILQWEKKQVSLDKTKCLNKSEFIHSRFKLVKNNSEPTATKLDIKTVTKRRQFLSSSNVVRSNQKVRMKKEMTRFKKNNIPCPLFKKYGTCLRNLKGKCEFLHDKKHVSICRKFLKGTCHDKSCLLSHEVTAEKMPTCSFYLKGMCTRDDCPYLHVKLNEKTKVCLDFLKGYCEKGVKCLSRHVNICPDQALKGTCCRKQCPYPHKTSKKMVVVNKVKTKILNQSMKSKLNKNIKKTTDIAEHGQNQNSNKQESKDPDCRYYREVMKKDDCHVEVEVMKPTRCKLGALPSFIQL